MKKTFIPLALAAALFTTGCKDSENIIDTPSTPDLSDHEAISFTMSDEQGASTTRAFHAEGLSRAGFTSSTDILMHIQSDEKTTSGTGGCLYTRTKANAAAEVSSAGYSVVTFTNTSDGTTTENNIRYWDDCYGRNAQLSVYAVAIPDKTISSNSKLNIGSLSAPSTTWGDFTTSENHNISWSVSTDQDQSGSSVLASEDLVYSNNIKSDGKDGVYTYDFTSNKYTPDEGAGTHTDGQMKFQLQDQNIPDGPGKFNRGHLKFNHSLSRITIELVKGTGFSTTDAFAFATGTQIQLNNMNISGTLAINTGTWTIANPETHHITKMQPSAEYSNAAGTYSAQMLPDYEINANGNTTNMLQFTIDDQTYFITQAMVFEALTKTGSWFTSASEADKTAAGFDDATNPTKVTMAQGKNYKLKITVNKTQISAVTATIAAWSDITAENLNIDNAHFTITDIYNPSGTAETGVHLFRIPEELDKILTSGEIPTDKGEAYQGKYYDDEATMTAPASGSNVWSTNWYFNDNKTLYHIRSLNDLACKGKTTGATDKANLDDADNTSFKMENGAQASSDYHWGAPMQADAAGSTSTKFKYDESNGFKAHLHKGLPSMTNTATNPINITELHMMSNINVVLKTKNDASAVNLRTGAGTTEDPYQYAKVELTKLYKEGTVDMGIGVVSTTGDIDATETMTGPESNTKFSSKYFKQNGSSDDLYETNPFTWAVVPQNLTRTGSSGTEYIGITITTPDNNQYYVIEKLSNITATAVGTSQNQATSNAITRWYPNHSYTYTFTITKKGIEAITCTVANWVDITAADTPIDLES